MRLIKTEQYGKGGGWNWAYFDPEADALVYIFADGLAHLCSLSLKECKYLYDEGMTYLCHVQRTLLCFDVSHCTGLSPAGLCHISVLQ
jgi:hypothetical protein